MRYYVDSVKTFFKLNHDHVDSDVNKIVKYAERENLGLWFNLSVGVITDVYIGMVDMEKASEYIEIMYDENKGWMLQ